MSRLSHMLFEYKYRNFYNLFSFLVKYESELHSLHINRALFIQCLWARIQPGQPVGNLSILMLLHSNCSFSQNWFRLVTKQDHVKVIHVPC